MSESRPRAGALELSILILCRDEEKAIAHCVGEALGFLKRRCVSGEVVVVDNGSRDRSAALARAARARVVHEARPGYGNAIIAGIEAAAGRDAILGDGDGEHDLDALDAFWDELREGHDFVFGNRFAGGIAPEAMSFLRRRIGNPDRSPDALSVAAANARSLGMAGRSAFVASDWSSALAGAFDAVVCNPPYVRSADIARLAPEIAREPRHALDGGADGLDAFRAVAPAAARLLAPAGVAAFEIGDGQACAAGRILRAAGFIAVVGRRDLSGAIRSLSALRPPDSRNGSLTR